ncbi:MAG: o-succinylbenzoate synthase [bacterium]|nr:o-succinylbenzoate synthase [bacterium]MDE0601269.1 o-succinylbenzoate synthase [bacterium]
MTLPPDRVFTDGPLAGLEAWAVMIPMQLRYRRLRERRAVLLRGPGGWGEFSPFDEYRGLVAARWLASALESALERLPTPVRDRIPVNVTVPPVPALLAAALVRDSGCGTAKVKVAEAGQAFDQDLSRVAAVREALGERGFLRLDVNGAWGVDEAETRLRRLEEFDLQYVEQPCATLPELAELRRRTEIPIAADESIRSGASPEQIVTSQAADILVMKVQPMGGVTRLLEWASRTGLAVVPSSALETSVGLAAGLAAAAALPELPYACGLATSSLLAGDVVRRPLAPEGGEIHLRRPTPAPELLERWRPSGDVACEMISRTEEAAALLHCL